VVKESYLANRQICFDGDGYSDEWQTEAASRGLKNLKTTVDALPEVISETTIETFGKYNVLSERELEARYEVWVEQYTIGANIEAETASSIARTLLIPAALKHLVLVDNSGVSVLGEEARPLTDELIAKTKALEEVNIYPDGLEDGDAIELAKYARDKQLTAMGEVREVADKLERIVADEFWPLPKYAEMLFIK